MLIFLSQLMFAENLQTLNAFSFKMSRRFCQLLLATLLVELLGCGGGANNSDSTPPIIEEFNKSITTVLIANENVIYAEQVATGRFELFSVDPLTASRSRISDTFSPNKGLRSVALSTDGSLLGYRADKNNDGFDELYVNSLSGSAEVQLVAQLPSQSIIDDQIIPHYNWQWAGSVTPNLIIFRSDQDNDDVFEIQSILADASNLQDLSGELAVACASSQCWQTNGDGSLLAFLVETLDPTSQLLTQDLYAAATAESVQTRISTEILPGGVIIDWQWAPDDSKIAYISKNIEQPSYLFSVNPDASERVLHNPNAVSSGVTEFNWSPDASKIAFLDDPENPRISLYAQAADGSNNIDLIDTLVVTNPQVLDWQWSPNSSQLAYRADQQSQGVTELFTVQSDGQWHRKINGSLLSGTSLLENWQWSPDSLYIHYFAEQQTVASLDEFYSNKADGSDNQKLSQNLLTGKIIDQNNAVWVQSDPLRAIYQITQDSQQVDAVYSVLANGTDSQLLYAPQSSDETIPSWYAISPDKQSLLYKVNLSNGEVSLRKVAINGGESVILSSGGVVNQAYWLNDSSGVVYVHQTSTDNSEILYSVLVDGTSRLKLSQ